MEERESIIRCSRQHCLSSCNCCRLKKSLFRNKLASEQKGRKKRKGSLETAATSNMDELFDLLMVAGSDRLEEQRVPLGAAVAHHILPTTSSEATLNSTDHTPKPATGSQEANHVLCVHDRQRSRSVGGSVSEWKEVSEHSDELKQPALSNGTPASSPDSQDLPPSTQPNVRRQSINNSLLFSSTLGCFSESTLVRLNRRSKKVNQFRPTTVGGYFGDAVEL